MLGDLASSCYNEVAESGWGPRSIIIKAEAYITRSTVCWARHERFTRIIHLTMTGVGPDSFGNLSGSHREVES